MGLSMYLYGISSLSQTEIKMLDMLAEMNAEKAVHTSQLDELILDWTVCDDLSQELDVVAHVATIMRDDGKQLQAYVFHNRELGFWKNDFGLRDLIHAIHGNVEPAKWCNLVKTVGDLVDLRDYCKRNPETRMPDLNCGCERYFYFELVGFDGWYPFDF